MKIWHYCILSLFSHVQLFVILWTVACQASLSMGLSRQECWNALLCHHTGDLPNPEINPVSLMYSVLAGGFFITRAPGKPIYNSVQFNHSVLSDSWQPQGLQHTRLPCPSPTPGTCSNSCPWVMPSNHLILCHPLLLPSSVFPSISLFQWVSALYQVTLELQLQHQSL